MGEMLYYKLMLSFRYTKHAEEKLIRLRKVGIILTKRLINHTVTHPEKREHRSDGTTIGMISLDETHVLRVVYRKDKQAMVIITMYPGRIKQYGLPLRS